MAQEVEERSLLGLFHIFREIFAVIFMTAFL
jgi:hypothetical protein